MRIYVDADACPVIPIVEQVAEKSFERPKKRTEEDDVRFQRSFEKLVKTINKIKIIGAGADAVDFALINLCGKNDIVVTQDYGVAAMALGKGAYAIHQSGKWYTDENIDQMLMERHLSKKARRASGKNHLKGPKKRTEEDDVRFKRSFEKLVMTINKTKDSIVENKQNV